MCKLKVIYNKDGLSCTEQSFIKLALTHLWPRTHRKEMQSFSQTWNSSTVLHIYLFFLESLFWTQGPNSWDSIYQVWPPAPKCQIKRPGEGRERRFITWLRTWGGGGRVSTPLILAIFGEQTWAIGLRRQGTGGGDEVIHKHSQSQGCSGWRFSQSKGSRRDSREDVIAVITWGSNLVPMRWLLLLHGAASFGGVVCPARSTVPYGKFQSLVIKMASVLSFLESKVIVKWL
jgi:hypothetical protein